MTEAELYQHMNEYLFETAIPGTAYEGIQRQAYRTGFSAAFNEVVRLKREGEL